MGRGPSLEKGRYFVRLGARFVSAARTTPRAGGENDAGPSAAPEQAASRDRFDAFISYSRRLDADLAPALQSSLQRFAKPWYRLRALRIFRDNASLSANPGLWSSIEQALDGSSYFILLASPPAAQSKWVGREVEHWTARKDPHRLLLVLTEGEIVWDEAAGDFDWRRTNAVPRAASGAYREEPRWVDLHWARTKEQISARDPRFLDAVADLAAPLHGRPKDELTGEDVRQHRRRRRVAWSAAATLAALTFVSVALAVLATRARNDARTQARVALSRQLAAQSDAEFRRDRLDRAFLLAAQSYEIDPTSEARSALLASLQRSPHLRRVEYEQPASPGSLGGGRAIEFSDGGRFLAIAHSPDSVALWDLERVHRSELAIGGAGASSVDVSSDGSRLAVGRDDSTVEVWEVGRRERVATLHSLESPPPVSPRPANPMVNDIAFSPDGRLLAWTGTDHRFGLWNGRTTRMLAELGFFYDPWEVMFNADGRLLAGVGRTPPFVVVWRLDRDGNPLGRPSGFSPGEAQKVFVENEASAFSPTDPDLLVLGHADGTVTLWDAERGRLRGRLEGGVGSVTRLAFSPDGRFLVTGDEGGIHLWDLARRAMTDTTMSSFGTEVAMAFLPDGRTVAGTGFAGEIVLNDIGRDYPPFAERLSGGSRAGAVTFSPNGRFLAAYETRSGDEAAVNVWRVATRELVDAQSFGTGGGADGTLDAAVEPDGTLAVRAAGQVLLWDTHARRVRRDWHDDTGEILFASGNVGDTMFSADGRFAADAIPLREEVQVRRVGAAEKIGPPRPGRAGGFSPDGRLFATASSGGMTIWETETGRRVGQISEPRGALRTELLPSLDGRMLAVLFSTTRNELLGYELELWDVPRRVLMSSGSLASDPPPSNGADAELSPDGRLLATAGFFGGVLLWKMNPEEWQAVACRLANRTLTRSEWNEFVGSSVEYEPVCATGR